MTDIEKIADSENGNDVKEDDNSFGEDGPSVDKDETNTKDDEKHMIIDLHKERSEVYHHHVHSFSVIEDGKFKYTCPNKYKKTVAELKDINKLIFTMNIDDLKNDDDNDDNNVKEGAKENFSYFILNNKDYNWKPSYNSKHDKAEKVENLKKWDDGEFLHGTCYQTHYNGKNVSILLFTRIPIGLLFKQILRKAALRYITKGKNPLKIVHHRVIEGLTKTLYVKLWKDQFLLSIPDLGQDIYPGTSLISLFRLFGVKVFYIWFAVLTQKRLLFVANNTNAAGGLALTALQLGAPVKPNFNILYPTSAIDFTKKDSYIGGTTDITMLKDKKSWDCCVDVTKQNVHFIGKFKPNSLHKNICQKILKNLDMGEQWVMQQMRLFNKRTFKLITTDDKKMKKEVSKPFYLDIVKTREYKVWETENKEKNVLSKAEEMLQMVVDSFEFPEKHTVTATQKFYWELDKAIDVENEPQLKKISKLGAVPYLLKTLIIEGSQKQKFALNILGKLSRCASGLMAIRDAKEKGLDQILTFLDSKLPYLVQAAVSALNHYSHHMVGADELMKRQAQHRLGELLNPKNSKNCEMEIQITEILIHIFNAYPKKPLPKTCTREHMIAQFKCEDPKYQWHCLQLMEVWDMEIPEDIAKLKHKQASFLELVSRKKSIITVGCVKAEDLEAADLNGLSDPYVVVEIAKEIQKTKIVKKDLNPEWNQELIFELSGEEKLPKKITLNVYDHDLLSADDPIGRVRLPFKESKGAWHNLKHCKSGRIYIRLKVKHLYNPIGNLDGE